MSFPNIPSVTPSISINRTQVVNLLLASIAFEELGLAHIINAEAEKIQAAVGTLPGGGDALAANTTELLIINQSVNRNLKTVLKKQMLLQFKLEDILDIPDEPPTPPIVSIDMEKFISADSGGTWMNADTAPGPVIPRTDCPLLIKFLVSNQGEAPLANVMVTDNIYGLIGSLPVLAAGASFEWVIMIDWEAGLHANQAIATGVYQGKVYTDSDEVFYQGV